MVLYDTFNISFWKKTFPFHIDSSHIWFAVEIKWLVSIWNAKLPWYEPSSSSSSLQCNDRRLLQVYTKTEDPSKVLNQMCNVKWGRLLWTVDTSTLRNFWTPQVQNCTELSMTNTSSTIEKHVFPKSNTVSVSAWHKMSIRCVYTPPY